MSTVGIPSKDISETRQPARYTVKPGTQSRIVINTFPRGVCLLYVEGQTNPKNSLKLYADKSGRTSFNYGPAKESDVIEKFVIDCDSQKSHKIVSMHIECN